ncbi:MAG TPA: DUF4382 domain-containing protein [Gammaproteobacteria bacterium]|nr:DUF4382 domain-containing protein [Gammaproteobacteria bacterium]
MRSLNRLFLFIAIPLISLLLFSCGGGGGSSTTTGAVSAAGTGTVTLLVTDAPSEDFNAINLTITQAELVSDRGSVVLFSGLKTFDLLQLATVTEIFSVTDVPAGSYDKIRLTLTDIELVMKDGSPSVHPALPGNGKLDLNPRGSFYVVAGESLLLQLDMDAEKSIKVTGTGSARKYQFRPVVFVKIVNSSTDTKLVRLQGEAYSLDYTAGRFDLCYIDAQGYSLDDDSEDGNPYCVKVDAATAPASFFDASGNPADITVISKGDIVTAVGRFAMRKPGERPSSKSDGQDGRSEDRGSIDDNSQDSGSSDDNSSDDGDRRKLVLVAEVIWPGDFEQVKGTARGPAVVDPSGDWFKFLAQPDQTGLDGNPIDSEVAFKVLLQNGTKLFSRKGEPLTYDDIQDGVPTRVDGIFDPKFGDLKSALVILDIDALLTQLTGTISSVETDYSGMTLIDFVVGDRCVVFSSGMRVFETYLDDDGNISFEQRQVYDLAADLTADVFGNENEITGCLEAETIIYEAQVVTP